MAIFHQCVKIISRSSGRSSVAAASYRSGDKLRDGVNNQTHDYTRKGGIVHTEILAPKAAPDWASDREKLWNAVEASEKRKDAQLAREVEVALPVELDREKQIKLVRGFAKDSFVKKGMIADIAIHDKSDGNPHAHIMLTMRDITPDGFGKKNRNWNNSGLVEKWRDEWEFHVNATLALEDIDARIDRRTLEAQGVERTPQIHVGRSPHRAEANERIKRDNETAEALRRELAEINVRLPAIELELKAANQEMERLESESSRLSKTAAAIEREREDEFKSVEHLSNLATRTASEAIDSFETIKTPYGDSETLSEPSTHVLRPAMTEGAALEIIEREADKIARPLLDKHSKEAPARKAELKKRFDTLREQYDDHKDNCPRRSFIEWVTGRDKHYDTREPLRIAGVEISYAKRWNQWIQDGNEILLKEREAESKYGDFDRNAATEREKIAESARAEALDKNPEAAMVIAKAERAREACRRQEEKAAMERLEKKRAAQLAELLALKTAKSKDRSRGMSR